MKVEPIRDVHLIKEIKDFLIKKNYRDYFLFHFGINTGLRIGDMLKLKIQDVRGKRNLILKEEKTDKEKKIPINEALFEDILNFCKGKDGDDWLFPSRTGNKPISRMQAYRIMDNIRDMFGLEEQIGCHTLRKTFGYHFYKRTKDIAMLQQIFNHSKPTITLIYIGITDDNIKEALDTFYL